MDLRERRTGPPDARHPWERARAAVVCGLVGDVIAGVDGVVRVVDIGAGDAYVAAQLLARFPQLDITCVDAHYDDDDLARLRAPSLRAVRHLDEARGAPFQLALLLDVIEHVDDDRALLADVVARLAPGGAVLLTVPAWPALFSAHDRALGHVRRYTPRALHAVVRDAGLALVESGTLFQALSPLRALEKARAALRRSAAVNDLPQDHDAIGVGGWGGGAVVSGALDVALRVDGGVSRLLARAHVPTAGLTAYALCRSPR